MTLNQGADHRPLDSVDGFWAKTDADGRPALSVRDHSIHVGCVGSALRDLLPSVVRGLLPPGSVTLVALHDIGKLSPGFLRKCDAWRCRHETRDREANWRQRESNHAKVSQAILGRWLDKGRMGYAIVAGGHHGKYFEGGARPPLGQGGRGLRVELEDPEFTSARSELRGSVVKIFGEDLPTQALDDRDAALIAFLTGFMTLSDWLGSDEEYFPVNASTFVRPSSLEAVAATARARASQALNRLGWGQTEIATSKGFDALFPLPNGPNRMQQTLWDRAENPGLFIVEAPMGCGKTEAALWAAHRRWSVSDAERGLYFALPTQLTSERVFYRLENFLNQALASSGLSVLVHGNAWLRDDRIMRIRPAEPLGLASAAEVPTETARDARHWFASSRKALLAPFGAGTIDQALLGVLPAKHCGLRAFGLAGKVVVIDEVHSYDSYTGTLVNHLVRDLTRLRATVIVLSATLTVRRKRELMESAGLEGANFPKLSPIDPYPMITSVTRRPDETLEVGVDPVDWDGAYRAVRLDHRRVDDTKVWEEAVGAAESGACVLVLRNTVALAQETWRRLRSAIRQGGPAVGLLHSRFPRCRRGELEDHWMLALGKGGLRPKGCLLVATQVVEQSVDIDADLLITDLAPTDLLFQRIGRLHRHELVRPDGFRDARAIILHPDLSKAGDVRELKDAFGPSAWVYPPYTLWRTHRHWIDKGCVAIPGDIRAWLETTYAEFDEESDPAAAHLRADQDRKMERQQGVASARARFFESPGLRDEEGLFTRWNDQRSADLVLLREPPAPIPGTTDCRIAPLYGPEVAVPGYEWNIAAAKSLHINVVRVPWHAVRTWNSVDPDWVRDYLEDGVLGVVDDRHQIVPVSWADMPYSLRWCPDSGVSIERNRTPAVSNQPSYDDEDGWW
ncbi:MAG: CRISPR-associated helicase Cas3' [Verrucomicrobiales bacterium]|nr:CRISPR-associated helicase Cas3' [Verrucomicrobiales bacterium]